MFSENKLAVKAKKIYGFVYSKLESFFSHDYFLLFIFLYAFFYFFFFSRSNVFIVSDKFIFGIFSFLISLAVIYFLFKFNKFIPVVSAGALLVFFSFVFQRYEFAVQYSLLYYIGYGILSASIVYSLIKQKNVFFWISLGLLFFSVLLPLISPQILIGDERVLLTNLTKLESGEFSAEDFGKHNYVNVSFVYFYYLVIIAKIFGVPVASIFFLLKFFFLLMIFLSFYLLSTQFVERKLAVFVVLIAFFPIQNIHLAPQMIGKFIIFLLFIYFYLKYFKQLNSRIILIVLMLLITYINLTTLYISVSVFGFFVFLFFFRKAISKKAYFTDIIILFMFGVLIASYSTSIDLFGLTEKYAGFSEKSLQDIFDEEPAQNIVREEELSSKANPFEQKKLSESVKSELIPKQYFAGMPFLRRFVPFINEYVMQFGLSQLIEKLFHYSLIALLVLTVFFVYPKHRIIPVFALAVFILVLFLVHLQFHDGVHATLEVTSILFASGIVLLFHRKPFYFILIMLLIFSFVSAPNLYDSSQFTEANHLFAKEFLENNLIGEKFTAVSFESVRASEKNYNAFGFTVSCIEGKPYSFYLNDVYLRCDDFARIGSIGKKIYENEKSKAYLVSAQDLSLLN